MHDLWTYMDEYLPNWRQRKALLNELALGV